MGEGAENAAGVDATGEGKRGERRFQREGVGVEPVEEGGLAEDAGIGVLGGVDVGVLRKDGGVSDVGLVLGVYDSWAKIK